MGRCPAQVAAGVRVPEQIQLTRHFPSRGLGFCICKMGEGAGRRGRAIRHLPVLHWSGWAGLNPRDCDGRGTLKLSHVETGGLRAVCGPQAHFGWLAEHFINLHLSLFTRSADLK